MSYCSRGFYSVIANDESRLSRAKSREAKSDDMLALLFKRFFGMEGNGTE
jgi:hypothetical protein